MREIKHNFKELKIWQKSRILAKELFLLTRKFPKDERYELVSQMRRAAISIPSNIAEGAGRNSNREFRRFLDIALSSAYELETQLIISSDLGYISEKDLFTINTVIEEIQKMIIGFRRSLDSKVKSSNDIRESESKVLGLRS
jgi:four helix bundle protein